MRNFSKKWPNVIKRMNKSFVRPCKQILMVDCGNWSSYILQIGVYIVGILEFRLWKLEFIYEMNWNVKFKIGDLQK